MWLPTLPPWQTTLWLAPAVACVILAAAWLAARLKSHGVRTGDTRKVFHFCIFTLAAVLSGSLGFDAVNLLGGMTALAVLAALRRGAGNPFYEALARESDAPHRSLYVLLPLLATALGGITSAVLFGSAATVGMAVAGFADAVAEPIGIRWGRHRYRVPTFPGSPPATRSLEGSAAVFAAAMLAAFLALRLRIEGASCDQLRLVGAAAAIALVSAVVEAFSHHGLDNLTLQVAASGAAWGLE